MKNMMRAITSTGTTSSMAMDGIKAAVGMESVAHELTGTMSSMAVGEITTAVNIEPMADELTGDIDKVCRICHGGTEDGRLIAPCLCKGSMQYVHMDCLQQWRAVGGERHYFNCSTCGYAYRMQRVAWARVLAKAWVTYLLTLLAMMMLIILAGYVGRLLVSEKSQQQQQQQQQPSIAQSSPVPPEEPISSKQDLDRLLAEALTLEKSGHGQAPTERKEDARTCWQAPKNSTTTELPTSDAASSNPRQGSQTDQRPFASLLLFQDSSWSQNWRWSFLSLEHWIVGTTVVGITSFVILFAAFPGVLFRGDLGLVSGQGTHIELIMLLAVVLIGFAKAFLVLQHLVLSRTRALILIAEEHILEVRSDDCEERVVSDCEKE